MPRPWPLAKAYGYCIITELYILVWEFFNWYYLTSVRLLTVLELKRILSVGFIKRGSPPEGEPLLEAGGGSWKWVILGLKLGLRGCARQGPQQEPGPLLAHCTVHAEM